MEDALNRLGLQGGIASRPERLFPSTIHAGIQKGNAELLELINSGFDSIPGSEMVDLERRWLSDSSFHFFKSEFEAAALTPQEESWLDGQPAIKLAVTNFLPPIDIVDETGQYSGFNAELIDLLNRKLGTNILPVFFSQWDDLVRSALTGKVNGALSFSRSPASFCREY